MGTSGISASGRYLLGDSPAEIRHLVEQAEVYAREANELFDLIGVATGTTAIDIACGVMGAVHLLAERVGAEGRVIGLDREARMVDFGRKLAEQQGLAVEFIEADATATGLGDHSFDLVHARTLLLNVQNPAEILAEMVRIAKPGGVVAVQEPDASAWNRDPPHPAFDVLRGAIVSVYRRTGKDFSIGRRIARMLGDAGLQDLRVRPTVLTSRRPARSLVSHSCGRRGAEPPNRRAPTEENTASRPPLGSFAWWCGQTRFHDRTRHSKTPPPHLDCAKAKADAECRDDREPGGGVDVQAACLGAATVGLVTVTLRTRGAWG